MKNKLIFLVLIGIFGIFTFSGCVGTAPGARSAAIREGQWERDIHHNTTEAAIFSAGGPTPNYVIPGEGH